MALLILKYIHIYILQGWLSEIGLIFECKGARARILAVAIFKKI